MNLTTTGNGAAENCKGSEPISVVQPQILRRRIGSTNYLVTVRFSETSKTTMQDKLLRLIESEVQQSA